MSSNWRILVTAFFWNLWSLLRSLATRKPKISFSSSQTELETGLYSPQTESKRPRKYPEISRPYAPQDAALPHSSTSLQDFRFTFKASPGQQISASRQEFLRHPSLESERKPTRRSRRSQESMEGKRLRRIARVPEFDPPPEILVEDWSTSDMGNGEIQPDITSKPPNSIFTFGINLATKAAPYYSVPSVIITPSTPTEENTSRSSVINSGSPSASSTKSWSTGTAGGDASQPTFSTSASEPPISSSANDDDPPPDILPDDQHPRSLSTEPPPDPAAESEKTRETEACSQTARLSIHLSDDDSGPVIDIGSFSPKDPTEGGFVFTDSLTNIAFRGLSAGQSPLVTTVLHPGTLGLTIIEPQIAEVVVGLDWEGNAEAPSFSQPVSSSTPWIGSHHGEGDHSKYLSGADTNASVIAQYYRRPLHGNSVYYETALRDSSVLPGGDKHDHPPDPEYPALTDGGGEGEGADGGIRYSILPYPDIFDFDMYTDFRASMATFGISSGGDADGLAVEAYPRLLDKGALGSEAMAPSESPTTQAPFPSTPHDADGRTPDSSEVVVGPPTLTKFGFSLPLIGGMTSMDDTQTRDSLEGAFAHSTPAASFLDTGSRPSSGGRMKTTENQDAEYSCEDAIAKATATTASPVTGGQGEYTVSAQFRFPTTPSCALAKIVSDQSEESPDVFRVSNTGSSGGKPRGKVSSFTESLSFFVNKEKEEGGRDSSRSPSLPRLSSSPALHSKSKLSGSQHQLTRVDSKGSFNAHRSTPLDTAEIKRYRDHYRHPAYSRSPPLPGEALSASSSFSSESKYQDSVASIRESLPLPLQLPAPLPMPVALASTSVGSTTPASASFSSIRTTPARNPTSPATSRVAVPSSGIGLGLGEKAVPTARRSSSLIASSSTATAMGQGQGGSGGGVRRVQVSRQSTSRRPLRLVNDNGASVDSTSGNQSSAMEGNPEPGDFGEGGGHAEMVTVLHSAPQQRPEKTASRGSKAISDTMRNMIRKMSMKRNIGSSKSVDFKEWKKAVDRERENVGEGSALNFKNEMNKTTTITRRRAGSAAATTTSRRTINLLREVHR